MQWDGLLDHLWSISCRSEVFFLFQSYLSDRYFKAVTPFDSSNLHPVSAGMPEGVIWSPLLFNLRMRATAFKLVRHCLVVGYTDDHTILTIIPNKSDRFSAAMDLNVDLASLFEYGHPWNIQYAPQKTSSLPISLKSDIHIHLYF